jgi:hypothetical protein
MSALRANYNVFLISRIWREADQTALKPVIRTVSSQAGGGIARTLLISSLVSLFGRGEAKEEVAVQEAAGRRVPEPLFRIPQLLASNSSPHFWMQAPRRPARTA